MKRTLIAAALLTGLAMPAFAFQCPADIAAIDAAIAEGKVPEDKLAEVQRLRDEGAALHEAGKHQESVDTLAQAKQMAGVQ